MTRTLDFKVASPSAAPSTLEAMKWGAVFRLKVGNTANGGPSENREFPGKPMTDPCIYGIVTYICVHVWCIYLLYMYIWLIFMEHPGKHTSHMDPIRKESHFPAIVFMGKV